MFFEVNRIASLQEQLQKINFKKNSSSQFKYVFNWYVQWYVSSCLPSLSFAGFFTAFQKEIK